MANGDKQERRFDQRRLFVGSFDTFAACYPLVPILPTNWNLLSCKIKFQCPNLTGVSQSVRHKGVRFNPGKTLTKSDPIRSDVGAIKSNPSRSEHINGDPNPIRLRSDWIGPDSDRIRTPLLEALGIHPPEPKFKVAGLQVVVTSCKIDSNLVHLLV